MCVSDGGVSSACGVYNICIHIYIYTHTHTYIHTYIHTYTHTYTHICYVHTSTHITLVSAWHTSTHDARAHIPHVSILLHARPHDSPCATRPAPPTPPHSPAAHQQHAATTPPHPTRPPTRAVPCVPSARRQVRCFRQPLQAAHPWLTATRPGPHWPTAAAAPPPPPLGRPWGYI